MAALTLPPDCQTALLVYFRDRYEDLHDSSSIRSRMELVDRVYALENASEEGRRRAKAALAAGQESKVGDATVPVVMPQVETATADLVETYLSTYPIFPVVASPELQEVAQQIETICANSAEEFQWAANLQMIIRDSLKYPAAFCEVLWTEKQQAAVKIDDQGRSKVDTEALFRGNQIKRLDPYNVFCDRMVPPNELATRGEFAGYTEIISMIEMKKRLLELPAGTTMNATAAFRSTGATASRGSNAKGYFVPSVSVWDDNSPIINGDQVDWDRWAIAGTTASNGERIEYKSHYEWSVLYCRIIPKMFKIPLPADAGRGGVPQIYRMIVVNGDVLVHLERMTNAHDLLPILGAQINEDGLGYQTKSFAEFAMSYQHNASALWTAGIEGVRRLVFDRMIYDPSRINKNDIERVSSVARIPVKSEAYGKPLSEAVYQIPYRADGIPILLQMAQQIGDMADVANGQNRVDRGSFVKGNKTRKEFETVMQGSQARPRLRTHVFESRFITPLKGIIRSNILQYQAPTELFNAEAGQAVPIEPTTLQKTVWSFQFADGAQPASMFEDPTILQQALQTAIAAPQLGAEWDLMGMYAYSLQLQGARWVSKFRRSPQAQQQYLQQTQQANNAVQPNPAPGSSPAPGA